MQNQLEPSAPFAETQDPAVPDIELQPALRRLRQLIAGLEAGLTHGRVVRLEPRTGS